MSNIPDPTIEQVTVWLKQDMNRNYVHKQGWRQVNQRFHGLARSIRPYILQHFPPEQQEAAFDGFTIALMALMRFDDIETLSGAYANTGSNNEKANHTT